MLSEQDFCAEKEVRGWPSSHLHQKPVLFLGRVQVELSLLGKITLHMEGGNASNFGDKDTTILNIPMIFKTKLVCSEQNISCSEQASEHFSVQVILWKQLCYMH